MSSSQQRRQNRAAQHVQNFARTYAGQKLSSDKLISFLKEIDRLAALDLQHCTTNQQRQKVYAVIAAAMMHILNATQSKGSAVRDLYNALTNLALGTLNDDSLKKEVVPRQKTAKEWELRAEIIVACEKNPCSKALIISRGAKSLGLSEQQVRKFVENFHGGLIKSKALHRNVKLFRKAVEAGETWPFDNLIS